MKNTALEKFFYQLDRSQFMDTYKPMASADRALPIGYGQTISQPSLVLDMTEALMLTPKCKTLEIGTGSGYQTCILAQFSAEVHTVERIQPLYDTARKRLSALGYTNIHFHLGDGSVGLPDYSPYDRIMVTAAASKLPTELIEQLSLKGILIIPIGDSSVQYVIKVVKRKHGEIDITRLKAVRFVPLVGKYSI